MDLKHDTVSTASDRCHCHRRNELDFARCMARVDDDRQMRQLMEHRNCRQIERVSSVGIERADATFAEDDVLIAFGHDVFRRHQEFLEGVR